MRSFLTSTDDEILDRPPSRRIQEIIDSLEAHGRYDSRSLGYIAVERWSTSRYLQAYKDTLNTMRGQVEGEPPSLTMVSEAQVSWRAEPADVGMRIHQRHIGTIRPELRQFVTNWANSGSPYPSGGGLYFTRPNKSYSRILELSKYPELRDIILNLNMVELLIQFMDIYLPLRYRVSRQILESMKNGTDPEALSRHNEEAGTGLQIRGRRLKRSDLIDHATDLDFLLPYAYMMGCVFAATQIAKLDHDSVWMIRPYDARIRGAIASRSDTDIHSTRWDGERLTIEATSQTRQAGSDGTGALSNSFTERRLMGMSVTEATLREYRHPRVEYPFLAKQTLLKAWSLDATPFPGKQYLVGEDLGLMEPIKSPADALFSRAGLHIAGHVLSEMLSGSGWTQAIYAVMHNHFIEKAAPDDILLALGDDMNLITATSTADIFAPYIKVKSTNEVENTKKVLGLFQVFSKRADPQGDEQALIGIVPRVIKTVSSASKRASYWGERLSNLPEQGELDLRHSEIAEETIKRDLPILKPYIQWKGKRKDLRPFLDKQWLNILPDAWDALNRHAEEWEHRIRPEAEPDTTDSED
jgi:hypothetical protein